MHSSSSSTFQSPHALHLVFSCSCWLRSCLCCSCRSCRPCLSLYAHSPRIGRHKLSSGIGKVGQGFRAGLVQHPALWQGRGGSLQPGGGQHLHAQVHHVPVGKMRLFLIALRGRLPMANDPTGGACTMNRSKYRIASTGASWRPWMCTSGSAPLLNLSYRAANSAAYVRRLVENRKFGPKSISVVIGHLVIGCITGTFRIASF